MKFQIPPQIILSSTLINDYISNKYAAFLKKIDKDYFYWDVFKYKKNLPYNDALKAWSLVKLHRRGKYETVFFSGEVFHYYLTTTILQQLHDFDIQLMANLSQNPITPADKLMYLKHAILEEAIASSQIEGAATTTAVALKMLKSGRKPRNVSEQMIFNNWRSIQLITTLTKKPLDIALIIEVHQTITANTEAASCAGNFRQQQIYVQDYIDGEIAHVPPKATLVPKYIEELCAFANTDEPFIHPIVKAAIIHFMFAYIHPFTDGNGRTARTLFYWFLLKKGYSLLQNMSISKVILNSRIQYDKAFLKTENDDNDLTYFINYSIKNLKVAFEQLIQYRDKKKQILDHAKLIAYKIMDKGMNRRQADLLGFLYIREITEINITTYAKKHNIVRQTARRDLKELVNAGLLNEQKNGRNVLFTLISKSKVEQFLAQ